MNVVALDTRETRRMSMGMRSYVRELAGRLPRVAPDLTVRRIGSGENFTLREQVGLPLASRGADVVHYPTIFAPLLRTKKYVVTIHDLIHLRYPELFGQKTAAYYRYIVPQLVHGAARICVGDERTVDDCERFLGVERALCRVVPLGYDPAILDVPCEAAPRPYVLYAGNHRPHKNLATLVRAWAALAPEVELDLVMTGGPDIEVPTFAGREARFIGDVPHLRLASYMRGAAAVVHPALTEGFGLPMLEALVLGVPVIASDASIPRFLAPYAALFAPHDVSTLSAHLAAAFERSRAVQVRASEGEVVARAYTWDRFAASTASVYREVLEDQSPL